MSQYGAYGFAKHGAGYREILRHYYTGTSIEHRGSQTVRVLLQPNNRSVVFRGATQAGERSLDPDSTYSATRNGSDVVLRSPTGRALERFAGVMSVSGGAAREAAGTAANGVGNGLYRGSARDPRRSRARPERDQRARPRELRDGRRRQREPGVMAGGRAPGAGRGGPHLRARDGRRRARLRPVRRHPQPGVPRLPERDAVDQRGGRRDTRGEVVTYGGKLVATYFFSTSGG